MEGSGEDGSMRDILLRVSVEAAITLARGIANTAWRDAKKTQVSARKEGTHESLIT
jgi:hypothetical protein